MAKLIVKPIKPNNSKQKYGQSAKSKINKGTKS